MSEIADIKEKIVEALYPISAYKLPESCGVIGLDHGEVEEAFSSKKSYISKRLIRFDKQRLQGVIKEMKELLGIDLYPEMNYSYILSEVTKRDLSDVIMNGVEDPFFEIISKITWYGRILEWDFISKVCDIRKIIPINNFSSFEQEYQQHRINNDDYDNDWFFTDIRFPFCSGKDSEILELICYIFNPIVRKEKEDWPTIFKKVNELINADGYELFVKEKMSGRDVFGYRKLKSTTNVYDVQIANELKGKLNNEYITKQIEIMLSSVEDAPYISIGKAKELLESVFKCVLEECGEDYESDDKLQQLDKKVRTVLNLLTSEERKEIPGVNKILGSLSNITVGMSELRNEYGDGHGKGPKFSQLPSRYARLAVSASSAYAIFLYETFEWLRSNNKLLGPKIEQKE